MSGPTFAGRLRVLAAIGALGLLGAELGARLWLHFAADEAAFRRFATLRQVDERYPLKKGKYAHHRYLGYFPRPGFRAGRNEHNSLGYRGREIAVPKPDGQFRVVCIGASTTYSSFVEDYRDSYPDRLEAELHERGFEHVRVVNAGVPNWSSWEARINVAIRIPELEPDLIIVQHAMTDTHARVVWPPEAFRADNSGSLLPTVSQLYAPRALDSVALLRIGRIALAGGEPQSALAATFSPPAATFYADDFKKQIQDGTYPSGVFQRVGIEQMLAANGTEHFRANLRGIAADARSLGAQLVLATFALKGGTPAGDSPSARATRAYTEALGESNGAVRSVAESEGCAFFDFGAEFPKTDELFADHAHMTVEGARRKARFFADFLVDRGLVSGRSAGG